jgi:glyoxylase-like metal-dependent hydrolase (beta-lactamase superfamily II)
VPVRDRDVAKAEEPSADAVAGMRRPQRFRRSKCVTTLYMIANGGGNTGIFIMSNGVALIDTKNPNNGPGILDQVKMVTNKPVTMIINTHTHADHSGSKFCLELQRGK